MFDSKEILRKEKKNAKENDFFMFGCPIKNLYKKTNIIKTS